MSRTSLETQKLDLIDEVSFLKLKLVSMEETHSSSQPKEPADTDQKKAEVWTPYGQEAAPSVFFPVLKVAIPFQKFPEQTDENSVIDYLIHFIMSIYTRLCLCSSPVAGFPGPRG